jgi:hypothetical protein
MRNLLIAACCATLLGSGTIASAQTASPANQDATTQNSMNSNAKMKKKHQKMKKTMKSDDSMKDMPKGDTKDAK